MAPVRVVEKNYADQTMVMIPGPVLKKAASGRDFDYGIMIGLDMHLTM